MNYITTEQLKESFPFEPYDFQSHYGGYSIDEFKEVTEKMRAQVIKTNSFIIKKHLSSIYNDMKKSTENLEIYRKLCSVSDKLMFTTDGSWIFNPLIYDENNESFHFLESPVKIIDSKFQWKDLSIIQQIDQLINICGGLVFRIFQLELPFMNNYDRNQAFTGKAIKHWCHLYAQTTLSEEIVKKYFSGGKSLGRCTYYDIDLWQDGTVKIYRNLHLSPREKTTEVIK